MRLKKGCFQNNGNKNVKAKNGTSFRKQFYLSLATEKY